MKETQQSTKVERHIKHLQEQHDDLDRKIRDYYDEYGNDAILNTMKKKKLKLKDEIETFKCSER
jgi:hypothetical protein